MSVLTMTLKYKLTLIAYRLGHVHLCSYKHHWSSCKYDGTESGYVLGFYSKKLPYL